MVVVLKRIKIEGKKMCDTDEEEDIAPRDAPVKSEEREDATQPAEPILSRAWEEHTRFGIGE